MLDDLPGEQGIDDSRSRALVADAMRTSLDEWVTYHWWSGVPKTECLARLASDMRGVLVHLSLAPADLSPYGLSEMAATNGTDVGDEAAAQVRRQSPNPGWRAWLRDRFTELTERHGAALEQHGATLRQVASAALRDGQSRPGVTCAVVEAARSMVPLPPPWVVRDAIDEAAREHRFSDRFWRQQGRAA